MPLNVLISNPSSRTDIVCLPYIYGLLKTHCDRDERLDEAVNWLKPIYRLAHPDVLLEGRDPGAIDVLGLSCYTWNWLAQRELARRVKRANPDALVVAGGPHCDYDDPSFFDRNPFLDIVVEKEGEEPFRRILRERIASRNAWEEIPGLYLPAENGPPRLTNPPELLEEDEFLAVSPYAAQAETFRDIIDETTSRGNIVAGIFESNRGCPYRCTFCDWGSLTFTKVRRFDMDRVKQDIRWMARHEVTSFGIADANLGMFERDVELVEYVGKCREQYGYPKVFGYNPTKTKATHLPAIIKTLHDHGLIARSVLSIEHTDDEVLDAIERRNLTREELDELIRFNRRHGIPMMIQLILGCPNDTYEKWQRCLTDLMEWGVDGQYAVANFQILPNAPAADDDYMDEWNIEMTTTDNIAHAVLDDGSDSPGLAKTNVITSTSSYDRDDWTQMWVYTHFVRAFHSMGLTHRVALYLRYCEGVPFHEFYAGLVDDFVRGGEGTLHDAARRIHREKREFLNSDHGSLDKTELKLLPDSGYQPQWEEWIFIRVALNDREVYGQLSDWLTDRFRVRNERTRDLVRYQRNLLVHPDYDPRTGKAFEGQYDWVEYFKRGRNQLDTPPAKRPRRFVIDQKTLGSNGELHIRWNEKEGDERLEAWINTVVKNRPYLPNLRFRNRDVTLHDVSGHAPVSLLRQLREKLRSLRGTFSVF